LKESLVKRVSCTIWGRIVWSSISPDLTLAIIFSGLTWSILLKYSDIIRELETAIQSEIEGICTEPITNDLNVVVLRYNVISDFSVISHGTCISIINKFLQVKHFLRKCRGIAFSVKELTHVL
jgi:hypothetical protein